MLTVADDFGLSSSVNAAIMEAFERNLITHASIIANGPAFEEACDLARQRGVVNQIGTHLNLTEGAPLTAQVKRSRRFCDEQGTFRYWRRTDHATWLHGSERSAVAAELREQVLKCRARGIQVSHLDSHNHVHNKFGIVKLVSDVALKLQVPRVRLAHNCGPHLGFGNRIYKEWLVNRHLRRAGLAGTRWYGGIDDYAHLRRSAATRADLDAFELNVHPAYRDGTLVDWIAAPGEPLEHLLSDVTARYQ